MIRSGARLPVLLSTVVTACWLGVIAPAAARAAILPDRVLLIWNSRSAESQAIRDAYLAARPGVRSLDLNDATIAGMPSTITRAQYLANVRAPVLAYLAGAGPGGVPLSQHIIAMVTTRGLPVQIQGASDEFQLFSTWSSVESELTLIQQNLEQAGSGSFSARFNGSVANPYSTAVGSGIDGFSRANIAVPRAFTLVQNAGWQAVGLTPGDIYLVTRLDAAPTSGATAVQNTLSLIARSSPGVGPAGGLSFDPCAVQASLDRWTCQPLDNSGLGVLVPARNDFPNAQFFLQQALVQTTFDQTAAFLTSATLPAGKPLIAVGTYGTNHALNGCGAAPPGGGAYVSQGFVYHPAAVFVAYESWSGNSMINGAARGGQGQALDFISAGGSFTVGSVAEPFTFAIPRVELLVRNLLLGGMTFAEAVYSAIPALSWQQTPLGDPLATVRVSAFPCPGDSDGNSVVDFLDLNRVLSGFGMSGACLAGDINRDGVVNFLDLNLVLGNYGLRC